VLQEKFKHRMLGFGEKLVKSIGICGNFSRIIRRFSSLKLSGKSEIDIEKLLELFGGTEVDVLFKDGVEASFDFILLGGVFSEKFVAGLEIYVDTLELHEPGEFYLRHFLVEYKLVVVVGVNDLVERFVDSSGVGYVSCVVLSLLVLTAGSVLPGWDVEKDGGKKSKGAGELWPYSMCCDDGIEVDVFAPEALVP